MKGWGLGWSFAVQPWASQSPLRWCAGASWPGSVRPRPSSDSIGLASRCDQVSPALVATAQVIGYCCLMGRSAAGLEFSSVASVNLEQVFASGNNGGVLAGSGLACVVQADA